MYMLNYKTCPYEPIEHYTLANQSYQKSQIIWMNCTLIISGFSSMLKLLYFLRKKLKGGFGSMRTTLPM